MVSESRPPYRVPEAARNPFALGFALKLLGAMARTIVKTGCLESLEQKAEETTNPIDDLAIRLLRNIIHSLSEI